jgi:phage portal protein BeeE
MRLQKETKDGLEWVENNPLEDLFDQPNPDMSWTDLMDLTSLYLDGTGLCLWHKIKDRGGRTRRLYPYHALEFTVEADRDRIFGRFRLNTSTGQEILGPDDVCFFNFWNPAWLYNGIAPLSVALTAINIDADMQTAIRSLMMRSIKPGVIFSTEQNLTTDQYERLRIDGDARWAGVQNIGNWMLLEGALKPSFLDANLKNLDLGPIHKDMEIAICQAFGIHPLVPGTRIGLESSGGFADSLGPAVEMLYDQAIHPTWRRIATVVTNSLVRPVIEDPMIRAAFVLDDIKALQDDMKDRADEAAAAGKFWTVNEGRIHTEQEPFPPGDPRGEMLIDGGGQPVEDEDDNEPEAGSGTPEPEPEDEGKAVVGRRETARLADKAQREAQEFAVGLAVRSQLAKDERAVELAFRDEFKADDPIGLSKAQEILRRIEEALTIRVPSWIQALEPIIGKVAESGAENAVRLSGIARVVQPGIERWARNRTAEAVTHITDTTRETIREKIGAGLLAGKPIRIIKKDIQDAGTFSKERAGTIAITEVTRARNGAALETMKAQAERLGVPVTKEWLNSHDTKVRETHRDQPTGVGRERVLLDQMFGNGLQFPGDGNGPASESVNCRCAVLFHVGETP